MSSSYDLLAEIGSIVFNYVFLYYKKSAYILAMYIHFQCTQIIGSMLYPQYFTEIRSFTTHKHD